MAIIIEEPKPPKNWAAIISLGVVLIIIVAGTYFLFFKKPVLIEMVIPPQVVETEELSQIHLDTSNIANNQIIQNLRPYLSVPSAAVLGRTNPFAPY